MCRFHVPGHAVVLLSRGLTNEFAVTHEFVPVHSARATLLTAFAAISVRAFLAAATAFVN